MAAINCSYYACVLDLCLLSVMLVGLFSHLDLETIVHLPLVLDTPFITPTTVAFT